MVIDISDRLQVSIEGRALTLEVQTWGAPGTWRELRLTPEERDRLAQALWIFDMEEASDA